MKNELLQLGQIIAIIENDLVHYIKCPEYHESYIGEIDEWICDHSGKDRKSNLLKQSHLKITYSLKWVY